MESELRSIKAILILLLAVKLTLENCSVRYEIIQYCFIWQFRLDFK